MRIDPNLITETLKKNSLNVAATAKELGIHRSTIYRWAKRGRNIYNKLLIASRGLKRLSTKPKTIHYALNATEKQNVASFRRKKPYSAQKIRKMLKLEASFMSIYRFLKGEKLVREYGYHRRPRFQDTVHMHAKNVTQVGYLQMDVKYITPELSGLTWTCFEYAVIDIYSRYKEAVILNQLDQDGSEVALLEILPKLPFKAIFIQTDNGLEFQGRFLKLLKELGIKHHFVHKRTPNENAVIERSFRTDEEEFFFLMERAPIHYDELRDWFATYLHEYNHGRPHFGVNLKTPAEVVAEVMLH